MWIAIAFIVVILALIGVVMNYYRPWQVPFPARKPPMFPADRGEGISLLVPFRSDSGVRLKTWNWLREYWRYELPGAQLCVGTSFETPFCKTAAVNQAADQATGDIVVVLDADCYISGDVIVHCADRIREARDRGQKHWYVPYRRFYRLTKHASERLLESSPRQPYVFPSPPDDDDIVPVNLKSVSSGHWWGALIQVMPIEAFEIAGGMDESFAGWGGEDVAFMRAVDTLYHKHKTTDNDVMHIWHPTIKAEDGEPHFRRWTGQDTCHQNDSLSGKYQDAFGDRAKMAELTRNCNWIPRWKRDTHAAEEAAPTIASGNYADYAESVVAGFSREDPDIGAGTLDETRPQPVVDVGLDIFNDE